MGLIIDIVVVAFILLSIYLGYKKGLVSLAIKLCAFIIAIAITVVLYKPIANLVINVTSIDETIENSIYEKVNDIMSKDELGEGVTNQLIESAKQGMLPSATRELSIDIIYAGTILILYAAVRIILIFITKFADAVAKLPIINQFNKTGGLIYGLLRGFIIIYAILLVINLFGTINPQNVVHQAINDTFVTKLMYENNIFNIFF